MSVLVDTGVVYAAFDSNASSHDAARRALRTVLTDGSYGRIIACCERADVDAVLSFDDAFDGLVDRLSPATGGN